jgi:hypothetical protein
VALGTRLESAEWIPDAGKDQLRIFTGLNMFAGI